MVRMAGIEPALPVGKQILSLLRLPVSPHPHRAQKAVRRPAVKRGRIVNKMTGDESEQLHERHDASDFRLRTQDKINGAAADQAEAVKDDAI